MSVLHYRSRRLFASGVRRIECLLEEVGYHLGFLGPDDDPETASAPGVAAAKAYERAGSCRFFLAHEAQAQLVAALNQVAPEAPGLIVDQANRICRHVFDLLGSGPTPLGDKIDWHADFKTGYRWNPKTYYKRIRPAPYPGGYDIKVPWELSRCQHFVWLGQAYWISGDEEYAREFVAQVEDWIESNPWAWGVNWACTMDVAIRAVNWLWGYHFFMGSHSLTDEFHLTLYKSLRVHGRHIFDNLEKQGGSTNNHYLAGLVGLIYLGILCPEFGEAAEWREYGLRELWQEMFKQVYPDGVDFEGSIAYHRLATEMFLSPIILCQWNDIAVPDAVMDRLEKMLEFVMHYTKPDGTVPLIGDADNGRVHRLKVWDPPEREWIDHRYLLAIGAVMFGREDFAQAAGDQWEEALWLLGRRALAFRHTLRVENRPYSQLRSRAFPEGGFYIMRHENCYLLVGARPAGEHWNSGHTHNDALGFELHVGRQTWLADSGQFGYTGDARRRNLFRSSQYHNVLQVDGEEINTFDEQALFRMSSQAETVVRKWSVAATGDELCIEHRGYNRLVDPVTVGRGFWFSKTHRLWLYCDDVSGTGVHTINGYWHFAPGLQVDWLKTEELFRVRPEKSPLPCLYILPLKERRLHFSIHQGEMAMGYGLTSERAVVSYSITTRLPWVGTFLFFLAESGDITPTRKDIMSILTQANDGGHSIGAGCAWDVGYQPALLSSHLGIHGVWL